MKPIWLVELVLLVLPAPLITEASGEEANPPTKIIYHAYEPNVASPDHAPLSAQRNHIVNREPASPIKVITGVIQDGVEGCQLLIADDHRIFSFYGNADSLVGKRVAVPYIAHKAASVDRSICKQGTELEVPNLKDIRKIR